MRNIAIATSPRMPTPGSATPRSRSASETPRPSLSACAVRAAGNYALALTRGARPRHSRSIKPAAPASLRGAGVSIVADKTTAPDEEEESSRVGSSLPQPREAVAQTPRFEASTAITRLDQSGLGAEAEDLAEKARWSRRRNRGPAPYELTRSAPYPPRRIQPPRRSISRKLCATASRESDSTVFPVPMENPRPAAGRHFPRATLIAGLHEALGALVRKRNARDLRVPQRTVQL